MNDSVDAVVEQWQTELPSIDIGQAAPLGRIHRISRVVQLRSDAILEQAGLSRGEFDVLAVLMRHGRPMAPTEIASVLSASPAGTTKRVHKLQTAGMLVRKPHESDRRSALLETTPRARDVFPVLLRAITSMEMAVLEALAPEARGQLDDALKLLLIELESPKSRASDTEG